MIAAPCRLWCLFYSTRPNAHYRRRKGALVLRDDAPEFRASKPDVDNLAKLVMDALNGVVLEDDRYIVDLHCVSLYWSRPGVYIYLTLADAAEALAAVPIEAPMGA